MEEAKKLKLDISVKWEVDEYPHTDREGTLTSEIPADRPYVDRRTGKLFVDGKVVRTTKGWYLDRHSFEYWIPPDNGYDDEHEYLLQDYLRACTYQNGDWHYEGCVVMVSLFGIGLAEDSLWGVESDGGESYHKDIAGDCISQAKHEAEKILRKLCALTTEEVDLLFAEEKKEDDTV